MNNITIRAYVYGFVQGVGFRYTTRTKALELKINGYAKNLDDGSVEVLASGDSESVDALIAWLKTTGPRTATINRVDIEPLAFQPFSGFAIL